MFRCCFWFWLKKHISHIRCVGLGIIYYSNLYSRGLVDHIQYLLQISSNEIADIQSSGSYRYDYHWPNEKEWAAMRRAKIRHMTI